MDHTRPTTLADVAARADVSVATASRVLNGSPHRVSQALADKVRQVAAELSYAPNVQAQGLARNTSSVVAMLLHDVTDPYFAQIAQGALLEAGARRVQVVIAETGIDPDQEREQLLSLRGFRPRATIVVGSRTTLVEAEERLGAVLTTALEAGAGVVAIGQPGLPGACIRPQNRAGAGMLAGHLTELGHRRFTVVSGPESLKTVAERREGFAASLPTDAVVDVIQADFSRDGGFEAGRRFCAQDNGSTAVFVSSDVMAGGFCTALREGGRSIPADVSVVGFDDVPVAADLYPALTTVRLPLSQMGRQALRLALDGPFDSVVDIPGELVVRGSTGLA
ncbi:LacI family transcriptional regulator [Stackebrandtia endophytica]|uniref:LacI family transcriptional regulator n=1 Tax=Stackebrandtia endophytica TaxID=1496996 RepID=A0A543AY44_9ACTN|nr:LacI family DNA-binding transcriptional regulator [Stackebrandtia endophytica]TQL77505.1 LacI family transcriptional regulator [Stackebrandtia endophytica]